MPFNWLLMALISSSGASDRKVILPEFTAYCSGGAIALDEKNISINKSMVDFFNMLDSGILDF